MYDPLPLIFGEEYWNDLFDPKKCNLRWVYNESFLFLWENLPKGGSEGSEGGMGGWGLKNKWGPPLDQMWSEHSKSVKMVFFLNFYLSVKIRRVRIHFRTSAPRTKILRITHRTSFGVIWRWFFWLPTNWTGLMNIYFINQNNVSSLSLHQHIDCRVIILSGYTSFYYSRYEKCTKCVCSQLRYIPRSSRFKYLMTSITFVHHVNYHHVRFQTTIDTSNEWMCFIYNLSLSS